MDMLLAMGIVLLVWSIYGMAFLGAGILVERAMGIAELDRPVRPLRLFFLGLALCIAFLQAWNFFLPISTWASLVFVAIGLTGFGLYGEPVIRIESAIRKRRGLLVVMLLWALWIANRAIGVPDAQDSGMYHFQVMRWANEFAVVPGLANLAGALALNHSSLLVTAMFNTGALSGLGEHFFNSLLLVVVGWQCLVALADLHAKADSPSVRALRLFWALLLPVLVFLALAKDASSPKTDLPTGLLILAMLSEMVALCAARSPGETRSRALGVAVLSSAAVCFKLSAAPIAFIAWCLAAIILVRRSRSAKAPWVRHGVLAVVASVLLVAPWMGRNVVMSGYPLYPSTAIVVPSDWTAPSAPTGELNHAIRAHTKGRLPGFTASKLEGTPLAPYAKLMTPPFENEFDAGAMNWIPSWFFALPFTMPIEFVLPMALLVMIGVCLVLVRNRMDPRAIDAMPMLPAVVPMLVGLGFWLVVAPDPRYGWPIAWGLLALMGAWLGVRRSAPIAQATAVRIAIALVIVSVPGVVYRAAVVKLMHNENPLAKVPFVMPASDGVLGFHPRPTRDLTIETTAWGLEVIVPDGEPLVVWDAPLPAVAWPWVDPYLMLREANDLSKGFKIVVPEGGDWEAVRPNITEPPFGVR